MNLWKKVNLALNPYFFFDKEFHFQVYDTTSKQHGKK